jgi:hypothetical protein
VTAMLKIPNSSTGYFRLEQGPVDSLIEVAEKSLAERGCCTKTCDLPAQLRVFWPGQTCIMCVACALRAEKIAQALGFDLPAALL